MTVRTTSLLVVCAFLLLVAAGCDLQSTDGGLGTETHAGPDPGTTWVILVDLSLSTLPDRRDYVDALSRVLGAIRPGDTLSILSIEKSSIESSHYLYQGTFPRYVFVPGTPPDTDNPLLLDTFKTNEAKRREAEQAEFDRTHDLVAEVEAVSTAAAPTILTYRSPATDIFSALHLAGSIFSTADGPRRLLMLTDGVVQTREVDFRRHVPTHETIHRLAHTQRQNHELPSLHGARVLVVGAHLGDTARFSKLRQAWRLYISRYARGRLEDRFFMGHLNDRLLATWLQEWAGQP